MAVDRLTIATTNQTGSECGPEHGPVVVKTLTVSTAVAVSTKQCEMLIHESEHVLQSKFLLDESNEAKPSCLLKNSCS